MLPAEINFTHFSLDFNIHYIQKSRAIQAGFSKSTVIKHITYISVSLCKQITSFNYSLDSPQFKICQGNRNKPIRAHSFARLRIPPLLQYMPTKLKKISPTHTKPIINSIYKGSWSPAHGVLQCLHTRICITSHRLPICNLLHSINSLFQQSKNPSLIIKIIP